VRVYPRLRSTNLRAAELLERDELRPPAAVVASLQTAGRGRGANAWWSDAGSLTVTFVFPASADRPPQELPLRAGLAVLSVAARHVGPERLRVKWPNDVLAGGRKLAGILCQRVGNADLVGDGLNVSTDLATAPPEVRRRAISLAELTAKPPTRADAFVQLALALREAWEVPPGTSGHASAPGPGWIEELNRVHALTGQIVAIDTGDRIVRGPCRGIDRQGRLLVETPEGVQAIASGQVGSGET
jgi:BirA family biotin operon repressor/biotin-[acetyl-CoA-carboxylase] ligase